MGKTQQLISALVNTISAQPNITEEEVRAQLNIYLNQRLMTPLTPYDAYMMLEANPAAPGQELHTERFSEQEMGTRRAVSSGIREGLIEYACWPIRLSNTYIKEGVEITREGRALFYYEAPGQTDPRNREVLWLMDANTANRPAYIEEKKRQLMAEGKTEQEAQEAANAFFTDDALRKRRSELVLARVAECAEIAQQAEDLTSDDLTPEQLAANYLTIMQAMDVANDIETFAGQARDGSGRFEFTEEQFGYLDERRSDQLTMANAVLPLENMGNPCYAFLDPEDMMDANIDAVIREEASIAATKRELNRAEDPNFDAIAGGEPDVFGAYATDALSLRGIRRSQADEREQERMREVYGFIPEETTQVIESRWDYATLRTTETAIQAKKPVAYEMGNRVVILTAVGTNSNPSVSTGRPEALFNHSLRRKSAEVYDLLDSTDVRYKISSPEFREMKRALDKVRGLKPLGTDKTVDRHQELENARKRFETLLTNTKAYLAKKPDHSEKTYTEKRIQAAKKVRAYAELKLHELELVDKARDTWERYKGMSDDEIRRATAAENEELTRLRARDARRKNPVGWLGDLSDRYLRQGVPEAFRNGFSETVDELRAFILNADGVFVGKGTDELAEDAALLAGYSAAGELILRERERRENKGLDGIGPLEATLNAEGLQCRKKWIRALGEQVIQNAVGVSSGELNREELSRFLASFDPKLNIDKVGEAFSKQCGAKFMDKIEERFSDVDPAIQPFVDANIVAKAKEYRRQTLDGTMSLSHDEVMHAVSCHILADLAQRNGENAEKLRQLMQKEKNIDALLTYIQDENTLKELVTGNIGNGGTTKIDDIRRLAAAGGIIANCIAGRASFAEKVDALCRKQELEAPKEFKDAVISQYGKAPFTEGALGEFVLSHIINPTLTYKAQMDAKQADTDFEAGYRMMSSCVLAQIVQLEDGQGALHRMMESREGIDTMLGMVQASKPFQEMIGSFCDMGDRPDIREIPKLIQDKQPQRAALSILKDARFKQMLEGAVMADPKPVREHSAPQNAPAQPQPGGNH